MTKLEADILRTIGNCVDEVRLNGDDDSFVEMAAQVIHVASNKHGTRFFKVTLTEVPEDEYSTRIPHDDECEGK